MNLQSKQGVSLLEILAVLAVIGFLATLVVAGTRSNLQDIEIITALNQMGSIRAAVVEGFYPEFGYIPEEAHKPPEMRGIAILRNQNPEYVTRFLCLEKDCTNQDIKASLEDGDPWFFSLEEDILDKGHIGCYLMAMALSHLVAQRQHYAFEKILPLLRDSAIERGWSGAYLEANDQFNATALNRKDNEKYPADFYSDADEVMEDVFLPVIATLWADDLKASAIEAEEEENTGLAAELLKGRYYQIRVCSRYIPARHGGAAGEFSGRWEQIPETAVIICRGPDGLPGPDEAGQAIGAEDYWRECEEMSKYGLTNEQRTCFDRFRITDPDDPDYVDIGDDMVLFIFGDGPVRSPLEK